MYIFTYICICMNIELQAFKTWITNMQKMLNENNTSSWRVFQCVLQAVTVCSRSSQGAQTLESNGVHFFLLIRVHLLHCNVCYCVLQWIFGI